MSTETRTIVVQDPPEQKLVLHGLGEVTVRGAGRSFDHEVAWRARRPLSVDFRAFANVALARSLEPRVAPQVVGGLPPKSRRKLMLSVIRLRGVEETWRSLYGSSLSFDERLFAVMLWAWIEDRERLIRRLRERHRQLADETPRTVEPALRSVRESAMVRRVALLSDTYASKSIVASTELIRSVQRMLGRTSSLRLFSGPTAMESLLGGWTVRNFTEPYRKQSSLLHSVVGGEASLGGLRAVRDGVLGVGRRAPPPGFASVLRPYASNPYAKFDASESFRSALAPMPRRGSGVASMFRVSDAGSKAMFDSAAISSLTALGARRWSAFGPEAFGNAVTTRLEQQVTAALARPLIDGRTHALLQPGGVESFLPALRGLRAFDGRAGLRNVLARMREFGKTLAEVAEFTHDWEDDPLWFLLSVFGIGAARRFAGLTRDQVEQALLSALAEVVTDGEFVRALREVLCDAPHLSANQRAWLDHGLEHAAAGDWVQAVPQMLPGLEGALRRAAVGTALIVERGGKVPAAEKLVKDMAMSDDFTTFLVQRVFGGIGNAFRHGRADSGERDQVLFAIVALAGWVDYFLELNSMGVLADELLDRLDDAIERATQVEAQLTASA